MISVRGLCKRHGRLEVLRRVDFDVRRGEVAVVIGPSGGGKSTFLRCINGLERFEGGEVRVDDCVLKSTTHPRRDARLLQAIRRRVGFVFQQFNLFPHLSVLENVIEAPTHVLGQPREHAVSCARELLARVGLEKKLDSMPQHLSGGQQQRVAIARALAMQPEAILFDEPTSALDPVMSAEVLSVVADLARSGQTMVVVTHAVSFVRDIATSIHVFAEGSIVENGPPDVVLGTPHHPVTRAFLAEVERT